MEGGSNMTQAGLLTCGSLRIFRLPGYIPSGIQEAAPRSQWPDRPGFAPGSLFIPGITGETWDI